MASLKDLIHEISQGKLPDCECDPHLVVSYGSEELLEKYPLLNRKELCALALREGSLSKADLLWKDWSDLGIDIKDPKHPVWEMLDKGYNELFNIFQERTHIRVLDKNGKTPMHYMAQNNNLALLISNKDKYPIDSKDDFGVTPLMMASSYAILWLIENGADYNYAFTNAEKGDDKMKILFSCLRLGKMPEISDINEIIGTDDGGYNLSFLRAVVLRGTREMVLQLLNKKQPIIEDTKNLFRHALDRGNLDIAELFSNDYENVGIDIKSDYHPFRHAIERGHLEVFRKLYNFLPKPLVLHAELSPIHIASSYNRIEMLEIMKDDYSLDAQDNTGKTPLHHAINICSKSETILWLLDHGARRDIKDKSGKTAIDEAKWYRDEKFDKFATLIENYGLPKIAEVPK